MKVQCHVGRRNSLLQGHSQNCGQRGKRSCRACCQSSYQHDKPDTSREKKESQLSNHLHQTVLWACLWSIFLVNDWGGRVEPTVVAPTPGQMVLGSKKSKLSTRNKPVGSICHRFLPLLLHEVLPWLWSGRVSQISPSLPRLLLVEVFITQWK